MHCRLDERVAACAAPCAMSAGARRNSRCSATAGTVSARAARRTSPPCGCRRTDFISRAVPRSATWPRPIPETRSRASSAHSAAHPSMFRSRHARTSWASGSAPSMIRAGSARRPIFLQKAPSPGIVLILRYPGSRPIRWAGHIESVGPRIAHVVADRAIPRMIRGRGRRTRGARGYIFFPTVQPPSMVRIDPVMKPFASSARNRIALATSCGSAQRPSAWMSRIDWAYCGFWK